MNNCYKDFFSIILYTIIAIVGSNGITFLFVSLTNSSISIGILFFASCLAIPFGMLHHFFFEDKKPAWIIFLTGFLNLLWLGYVASFINL